MRSEGYCTWSLCVCVSQRGLLYLVSVCVCVWGGGGGGICVCVSMSVSLSVCLTHIFSDMVSLHVERKVPMAWARYGTDY